MAHFGDFYTTISQPAENTDFQPLWSTSADASYLGTSDMSSLSGDAAKIVEFVRYKLGEPIVNVELANEQIFIAFEEANLAYSSIINTSQAESWFADLMGMKADYTSTDLVNKLPNPSLDNLMRMASEYGEYSKPYAGDKNVKRGFLRIGPGRQRYDIYAEGRVLPQGADPSDTTDAQCQILNEYLVSISAGTVDIKNIHYYRNSVYGRAVDPYSSYMWLDSYQSGTNNFVTAMYMQPIWQDVLRMTMLKTSDQVRKSDTTWYMQGTEIFFIPVPKVDKRIYFEFVAQTNSDVNYKNPWTNSLTGASLSAWEEQESATKYITGLQNVPFKEIKYNELNSIGRYWIRMYTLALCKEMLGANRSKFGSSIEIPGGSMTLDGQEWMQKGLEAQKELKDELRTQLEKFTNDAVAKREAEMAESLNKQLSYVPLGAYTF